MVSQQTKCGTVETDQRANPVIHNNTDTGRCINERQLFAFWTKFVNVVSQQAKETEDTLLDVTQATDSKPLPASRESTSQTETCNNVLPARLEPLTCNHESLHDPQDFTQ